MNLADWLKKSHPPTEQVNVVEAVCDALHQAHVSGTLRGEIGPGAIEVLSSGCEVNPGSSPAPPSYRAPESRSGSASGPAAAVFCAGVLLYEILAGRNPFPGGTSAAQPEPLRNLRRDLPSELTDAVMACLESDPDWRPKDLSYVLQVLRRLRGNTPVATTTPVPSRSVPPRPTASESRMRVAPARPQKPRTPKGARPPLLAIAVGATVMIAAGGYYWLSHSRDTKRAATTPRPSGTPLAAATTAAPTPGATQATRTPAQTPTPLRTAPTPVPAFTPLAPAVPTPTPQRFVPTPTPLPVVVVVATPPPTPLPTRPPTPPPTPAPALVAAATPRPTPTLALVAAATPPPASAALATLKSLAPPSMPRGTTNFYDLHGAGLQAGLSAVIMKGRDVAAGIVVTKQVVVSPVLMRIVVRVDASVAAGSFTLVLVDSRGQATNPVSIKVP